MILLWTASDLKLPIHRNSMNGIFWVRLTNMMWSLLLAQLKKVRPKVQNVLLNLDYKNLE